MEVQGGDDAVEDLLQGGRGVATVARGLQNAVEALADAAQALAQSCPALVDAGCHFGAEERHSAGPGEFGERPGGLVLQVGAQVAGGPRGFGLLALPGDVGEQGGDGAPAPVDGGGVDARGPRDGGDGDVVRAVLGDQVHGGAVDGGAYPAAAPAWPSGGRCLCFHTEQLKAKGCAFGAGQPTVEELKQ